MHVFCRVQIQAAKRKERQRNRRLPFVRKEVAASPEAKGCDVLETKFLPYVNRAFEELESKAIAMQCALEDFVPSLRLGLSSLGHLDPNTVARILSTKPKLLDALKVLKYVPVFKLMHTNGVCNTMQDIQNIVTTIGEFGNAVTVAVEALHPDVLNSDFSSNLFPISKIRFEKD